MGSKYTCPITLITSREANPRSNRYHRNHSSLPGSWQAAEAQDVFQIRLDFSSAEGVIAAGDHIYTAVKKKICGMREDSVADAGIFAIAE